MKRYILPICMVALLGTMCPSGGEASSNRFFDLSSGWKTAGLFASFTDDISYYFSQFRFKPGGTFEAGIKAGAADLNSKRSDGTGAYLGLDAAFKIISLEGEIPFDIYGDLGFSTILKSRRAINEFFFGPVALKSLTSGSTLSIDGTLGLEAAFSGGSLANKDEFDLFLTAGLTFNLGEGANIFIEGKGGTDFSGGLGVNFEF